MIEKAIRSALNQTLSPFEVLVCDDGSTDNSEEIVNSINDSRVKWVPGPHGGLPAIPRNRGISESRGEWLAFLDSDDEWLPGKLQKQLQLVDNLNCKALCSNAYHFVPEKGIKGNLLSWSNDIISFDNLVKGNQVICSSSLIHHSLLEYVIGFPEDPDVIEDYALWLRVATRTDFAFVNEPLVIYRDDPKNSIRGKITEDIPLQRKHVLRDFSKWTETAKNSGNLLDDYILRMKNHWFLSGG
jgi:glycosyltransferase involved in cell wall biosynthesis